ncbi:polysaccharide deacetylase family protein [Mesorhizobium opportunistum]|uniref:Chitooligosaccharide deacetylase n=1 Tax=Mesorhizobium opportunistum TaxID=593909 RepID=A0ABV1YNU5_9HYPH|nr:polysaccharide deacetylase family protein [Mesorhizobium sp.]
MSVLPAHGADRTIYLTFDDGPLSGTGNILDVLQASHLVSEIDHLFGYGISPDPAS